MQMPIPAKLTDLPTELPTNYWKSSHDRTGRSPSGKTFCRHLPATGQITSTLRGALTSEFFQVIWKRGQVLSLQEICQGIRFPSDPVYSISRRICIKVRSSGRSDSEIASSFLPRLP